MSYRFSARFAVTIGCAIYAATSFAEMTFSKYSFEKSEIIGVWSKDIEDPSSANAIMRALMELMEKQNRSHRQVQCFRRQVPVQPLRLG